MRKESLSLIKKGGYNNKNISFNTIDSRYLTDEEKIFLETDIDNSDITRIGMDMGIGIGKKGENIHRHIANIRKYINKF